MAEKVLRQFPAEDARGQRYEIVEYVMLVTTTQLSDSHLATEQGPSHYRLANGDAVVSLGDGKWRVTKGQMTLHTIA